MVNPAFLKLTGYNLEELQTLNWAVDLTPEKWRGHECEMMKQLIKTRRPVRYEKEFIRKDKAVVPVENIAHVALDENGSIEYLYGFFTDISERKKIEKTLLDAKQLAEAANSSKSQFLATMSHEIRTPMNSILGFTDLVLETSLNKTQREYLQNVRASGRHLLGIINDILDLSKIEAGKIRLEMEDFHLRKSLNDLVRILSVKAVTKGLELICHVHPETPDSLRGDFGKLRQVIFNLISNSIKFTSAGEILLIEGLDEIEQEDVALRFSVTDSGIGIPAHKHETIFEAFAQADSSHTREYGGTGLGLTISKRLVELMGGKIWVDSRPNEGCTFIFTAKFQMMKSNLPVERKNPTTGEKLCPNKNLVGLKILMAEDNPVNQKLLSTFLEILGHQHVIVENGLKAVQALEKETFDLVLMDVEMPVMDGVSAVKEIRKLEEES